MQKTQPMGQVLTLFEKIWRSHVVMERDDGVSLLYVDLHLVQDGSAPAFEMLHQRQIKVRVPSKTFGTPDHYIPTLGRNLSTIRDPEKRAMAKALEDDCDKHHIPFFGLQDSRQGIIHVIAPEQGLSQPGQLIVCGDSHTGTHGAFGALAFGIGASEVAHVLATQVVWQQKPLTMRINIEGTLGKGVTAKDIILAIIAKIGTGGGQGYVIEYRGEAIRELSMEARMTVCNMSIEAGARAGLIAPDETTFAYIKGKPHAPEDFDAAVSYWKTLFTDADAKFDVEVDLDADDLEPFVTWGTNPGQGIFLNANVPNPADIADAEERGAAERALVYMGLTAGQPMKSVAIDTVFLGSCTNGRIEDLRAAAEILKGKKISTSLRMLVVPGSARVRLQAEAEGLDKVFIDSGAEWRNAGCSMCLGMNPDQLKPEERSASTSNRNFEGRQGNGGRTHLVSPLVAAATALRGTLSSPADL